MADLDFNNILFLIGFALLGGAIGGKIFQKIKIPQVVGYIVIGLILGESFTGFIKQSAIVRLEAVNFLSLSLIGFTIGSELTINVIKKYGKQFLYILSFEVLVTFVCVFSAFFISLSIFSGYSRVISLSISLLLAAISTATAAAGTTDVLKEYKAKGPLTKTVLGIIALDDLFSFVIFAICATIAYNLIAPLSVISTANISIVHALFEIILSIVAGAGAGYLLSWAAKKSQGDEQLLIISLAMIIFITGISVISGMDMLLVSTVCGVVFINLCPGKTGDKLVKTIEKTSPPIYVLFFVLVGAKMNINAFTPVIFIMGILYIVSRSVGKITGSKLGAKIAGSPLSVMNNLPFCLLSQSGAAIGLAIMVSQRFPEQIGNTVILIITFSTIVVQLLSPSFIKRAIKNSGEEGLNITEDEILNSTTVSQIAKRNISIAENTHIKDILRILSRSYSNVLVVKDMDNQFSGLIDLESLKETFSADSLNSFLLAFDLADTNCIKTSGETPLIQALELMRQYGTDYITIFNNDSFEAVIEEKQIRKFISNKMFEIKLKSE